MNLWECEEYVTDMDIEVPAWIDQGITCYDVAGIVEGGCASGAYMPAVTYCEANDVMAQYGDDVLEYIEDVMGELPSATGKSWTEMASFYLSVAVELWAMDVESQLTE